MSKNGDPGVSSLGAHTVTGVATSIAVFAGWAPRGPVREAVMVTSWSDFTRAFGGLTSSSHLGYAVNQFFGNGGGEAYIVRIVWDDNLNLTAAPGTSPVSCATAAATVGGSLTMWASSPGVWANGYQIQVTISTADAARFSIRVLDATGDVLESFSDLSAASADARYAVSVIDSESAYVTFLNPAGETPASPCAPSGTATATLAGGADGSVLVPATDGNFEVALNAGSAATAGHGIRLLDRVDAFNVVCVPGETDAATIQSLQQYCAAKRAFLIVDAPQSAGVASLAVNGPFGTVIGRPGSVASVAGGSAASNSAYYFPWVEAPDPLAGDRPAFFPPSGFVAGIYAATDANRGVWKAPAGADAPLAGATGLHDTLSDADIDVLDPLAINCLRPLEASGDVVWGARTLAGSDEADSHWKYVPIRRVAMFVESSLDTGTQWVVFEPNGEPLWAAIRLEVGAFMQSLFVRGAFQGSTPQSAYFVKCDAENNPQSAVDAGIVNIQVGFAPLSPAEFVVIQIAQWDDPSSPAAGPHARFTVNTKRYDPYKNFKFR